MGHMRSASCASWRSATVPERQTRRTCDACWLDLLLSCRLTGWNQPAFLCYTTGQILFAVVSSDLMFSSTRCEVGAAMVVHCLRATCSAVFFMSLPCADAFYKPLHPPVLTCKQNLWQTKQYQGFQSMVRPEQSLAAQSGRQRP